jgi:DNA-binding response OmpR family regulator
MCFVTVVISPRVETVALAAYDLVQRSKAWTITSPTASSSLSQAFCAAPQRMLSRGQLLELSRLISAEVYDRSIDVQILRLRRKIEPDPSAPRYILTERGAGYLFDKPVDVLH